MMELYVLDSDFREVEVIDSYESFIWTERFDDYGDFELHMAPMRNYRSILLPGTVLSIAESNRMMIVETVSEKSMEDGGMFVYSGRSFESILEHRVARSGPSGSYKTWMNVLTRRSMIEGLYDSADVIQGLSMGLNRLYPASSIPPSLSEVTSGGSGWFGVGDAHTSDRDLVPLGFRIVRKPFTRALFYDNYTGHDLSKENTYDIDDLTLSWPNPFMYETDNDQEVWRNLAVNPGFNKGVRPLAYLGAEHIGIAEARVSEVECEWSRSGNGLRIASSQNRTSNGTRALMTTANANIHTNWIGGPWAGRTFTLSARVEITEPMSGDQHAHARSITVSTNIQDNTPVTGNIIASAKAPNTVGVHDLSVTFTIPTSGDNRWTVYLWNGNGVEDEGVLWGDFCLVELPSNPVGYFDEEYSPDPDLTPRGVEWSGRRYSVLTGKSIQGVGPTDDLNCAFVQSGQWGPRGGISGRMIRNTTGTETNRTRMRFPGELARSVQLVQYQDRVITGPQSGFGRVELWRDGQQVSLGSQKPNAVGDRTVNMNLPDGFDEVILRGNYSQLGASMWWGMMIVSPQINWTPKPNKLVIFSEDLDSFVVSDSRLSIGNYFNVAYVTRGNTVLQVDDGFSETGTMRRVIHVDADDLDPGADIQRRMEVLGREALGAHRRSSLIDGEVPPYSRYTYDEDYSLGDVVVVRNRAGQRMVARVVEQIFVNDQNGFRTYPTLREEQSVLLGEWYSPEYRVNWSNAEHLGQWADQP